MCQPAVVVVVVVIVVLVVGFVFLLDPVFIMLFLFVFRCVLASLRRVCLSVGRSVRHQVESMNYGPNWNDTLSSEA